MSQRWKSMKRRFRAFMYTHESLMKLVSGISEFLVISFLVAAFVVFWVLTYCL